MKFQNNVDENLELWKSQPFLVPGKGTSILISSYLRFTNFLQHIQLPWKPSGNLIFWREFVKPRDYLNISNLSLFLEQPSGDGRKCYDLYISKYRYSSKLHLKVASGTNRVWLESFHQNLSICMKLKEFCWAQAPFLQSES